MAYAVDEIGSDEKVDSAIHLGSRWCSCSDEASGRPIITRFTNVIIGSTVCRSAGRSVERPSTGSHLDNRFLVTGDSSDEEATWAELQAMAAIIRGFEAEDAWPKAGSRLVLVPVGQFDRRVTESLAYGSAIPADDRRAVHVAIDHARVALAADDIEDALQSTPVIVAAVTVGPD